LEDRTIRLEKLFVQLEDLILNCPKVPLTNKIIIDEDRLIDLIDNIRQELPVEFREAQELVLKREAILTEAQKEAEGLKGNAEKERMKLVSETEIYRQGQLEVDRLIKDARQDISAQQDEADRYADEVLNELELKIDRALQTIRNGRQYLAASRN
jgi:regulator of protease activity HflC (stomatin/prohibitin superfamily)